MRIVLTKKYAVHSRVLPKGTELDCTSEKAIELIELGVAEVLGSDLTKAELATVQAVHDKMVDDGDIMPETPIDEVKVITPKGKSVK